MDGILLCVVEDKYLRIRPLVVDASYGTSSQSTYAHVARIKTGADQAYASSNFVMQHESPFLPCVLYFGCYFPIVNLRFLRARARLNTTNPVIITTRITIERSMSLSSRSRP